MPEITQEEFEMLEAYKQIGEPEHIVEAITERNSIKRQSAIAIAAQLNGYKPNVLDKLAKDLEITVRGEEAFVVDGEKETKLSEYAEENWGDFIPSLTATADKDNKGVTYIAQSAKGKEVGKKDNKKAANAYIQQKYGWVLGNDSVN